MEYQYDIWNITLIFGISVWYLEYHDLCIRRHTLFAVSTHGRSQELICTNRVAFYTDCYIHTCSLVDWISSWRYQTSGNDRPGLLKAYTYCVRHVFAPTQQWFFRMLSDTASIDTKICFFLLLAEVVAEVKIESTRGSSLGSTHGSQKFWFLVNVFRTEWMVFKDLNSLEVNFFTSTMAYSDR